MDKETVNGAVRSRGGGAFNRAEIYFFDDQTLN
jgi:hypothetical protein